MISNSFGADFQFLISDDVSSHGHLFSLSDLGEDIQASLFLQRESGNQDDMGIQG
jgi:hypothetical protein